MACVSVLIGQCGNQLGATIYGAVATEAVQSNDEAYQTAISRTFFREPSQGSSTSSLPQTRDGGADGGTIVLPETRSILVDMEPKVIEDSIAKAKQMGLFSVGPKQCVAKEEGSANNWAFGYSQQGPSRREAIADNLRKEAEEGGAVGSFQLVHSLAGGTGSGVGTLTSEIVREEFPHSLVMHTAVLPFSHGEVITQWYNLIFTLAYINETADAITLLANDDFSKMIKQAAFNVPSASSASGLSPQRPTSAASAGNATISHDAPTTSLHDINELMGDVIASAWLPSSLLSCPPRAAKSTKIGSGVNAATSSSASLSSSSSLIRPSTIADIVDFVACDPSQKLLQASCYPFYARGAAAKYKNSTWGYVVGAAMRERASHGSERYMLCLRGANAFTPQIRRQLHSRQGATALQTTAHYGVAELGHVLSLSPAAPAPDAILASNIPFRGEKAFVSLFDTSKTIGQRIAYAAHKAERMFDVNAFTHHFHRFGVEDDAFREALQSAWHLAKCYGDEGGMLDDDYDEDCFDDEDAPAMPYQQ